MKPKYFMPVHGEFQRVVKLYQIQQTGSYKIVVLLWRMARCHNLLIVPGLCGKFTANSIYVDGSGIGDIGHVVIHDRRNSNLSEDGFG